jgi:crotonobetainyl-CoA:carnitine CoA-transferase CaiB-like acyl-CoA transferase
LTGPARAPDDLGPLTGLRVLEVATLYAAPQVATMLGDLGADVVKVEGPDGDPLRLMGQRRAGRSAPWQLVGRNKRSIVLDLEGSERERETFDELVRVADVLVENLTPALRERRHCTYDELAARNPGLVVVSVSCYGSTGPYAERPGAGTLAEAYAGLTHMTGEAEGPPTLASVAIGDTLTAFAGVIGALAACWGRDARGRDGAHVDVSMYEPIIAVMAATIAGWDPSGPVPIRSGSRVAGGAPRNVYRTADDRYVAVSGTTDAQVARVLALVGQDDPASRARFGRAEDRLRAADELDALVADWVAAHDRDTVVTQLLEARVGVTPVNDVAEVLGDPHVVARGSVLTVGRGDGAVVVPAPLPRVSGSRRAPDPAPDLGADREAVLREWLSRDG